MWPNSSFAAKGRVVLSLHEPDLAFLGELTNIGAGNAATAMASFLHSSFEMEPPSVNQFRIGEAVNLLGEGDEPVTVALLTVTGELSGLIALFVPDPTPFLDVFQATPDMASAIVGELGNIVAARFMGAVESMIGISGYPEPPAVATASRSAVLETVLAMSAQMEPFVLVKAGLSTEGGTADILFIPSADAVDKFREIIS